MLMALLTTTEIQSTYAEAQKLHQAGKLDEALKSYGRIIESNPKIAEAHFQAAKIFLQANRIVSALPHIKAAIQLRPSEAAIWHMWADAVALLGDTAEEKILTKALKSAPIPINNRIALQDRFGSQRSKSKVGTGGLEPKTIEALVQLMNSGRHAEAETRAQSLLNKHPKAAVVANILATAQASLGKVEPALANYQRACKIDPNYAEAHDNFGQALLSLNRLDEAVSEFRKAVTLAPGMTSALTHLGVALTKNNDPEAALPYLNKAIGQQKDYYPAIIALGNTHTRLRNYKQANEAFEKAVELTKGKSAEAVSLLAQGQSRLGKDDEALSNFDRGLQLAPDNVVALGGKGHLLQALGEFKEADTYFKRVMELDPKNGDNYRLYFASYKAKPGDPIIETMIRQFENPTLTLVDRMNLGFALSKAMEDIKAYDKVFRYLDAANAMMRKLFPYNNDNRKKAVALTKKAYSDFDWSNAKLEGTSHYAPIFVTGMPRSGTTLIEQIISSHSTVAAGGEIGDAARRAHKFMDNGNEARLLADVPAAEVVQLGHDIEKILSDMFPDAPRITDKSIQTYMHLGLIRLAVPNAKFVVVRRDPRDNLLSIYKNKFPDETHQYAYDQNDLAEYYSTFVEMIDFWRAKVPDWFYEVQYEELVANPEEESRKLIAACGLEWEDACLNFHENKRKIETLSVFQARQPISKGSVKAWQRYEKELKPMLDALRESGHVTD
jgi:tetratricopeptide (TPR) repeat protein